MAERAASEADERGQRLALSQRMNQLLCGFQISAAIGAVARLGVADALASAPACSAELAERLGADGRSLERVLRVLTDTGLFEEFADGRFALTALGETLRSDVPGSVRRAAMLWTEEWHWRAYGHFASSVRTGEAGDACGPRQHLLGVLGGASRNGGDLQRDDVIRLLTARPGAGPYL